MGVDRSVRSRHGDAAKAGRSKDRAGAEAVAKVFGKKGGTGSVLARGSSLVERGSP